MTRRAVAARYDLSHQGAINAINTLMELGVLREAPNMRGPYGARVYQAPAVVEAISA